MSKATIVILAVLALGAVACAGNEDATKRTRGDDARLKALGLTRRIPAQVHEACAEARRLSSVRVVCPQLIPDVPLTRIEGLWGSITYQAEPRVWMVSFNNAGGFYGRPLRGVEHWIVGGGKAAVVEKWVLSDFPNEVKGEPVLARTSTVRGRRARIYRFPSYPAGGVNGSHWAAFVAVGDELVFASLHGEPYVDAAVEMALGLAKQAERARR